LNLSSPKYQLVGLALGGLFAYLAFRGTDLSRVLGLLGRLTWAWIILAVLLGQGLGNLIRVWRWRLLLGRPARAGFWPLAASLMIGYLANNALPARLGELVRVNALNRQTALEQSRILGSIAVERLADVAVLLMLLPLSLLARPFPEWLRQATPWLWAGVLAALALALVLARQGRRLGELARATAGWKAKLLAGLAGLAGGLASALRPSALLPALGLSLMVWTIEILTVWLICRGAGLNLEPVGCLFVVAVVCLGMVLPAAPGFAGSYEFLVVLSLMPFGMDKSASLGLALLLHVQFLVLTSLLGLASWSWLSFGGRTRAEGGGLISLRGLAKGMVSRTDSSAEA